MSASLDPSENYYVSVPGALSRSNGQQSFRQSSPYYQVLETSNTSLPLRNHARTTAGRSAAQDFRGGHARGPNDVFIAVMGVTGSGKSSFISKCSGKPVEIGHDLNACTATVDVYSFDMSPDRTVYLIDTPGFDDTSRSDTEVLTEIATWLGASYRNKILLHGIIYLHRITDIRMQGSARKNLMMFKQLCGEDALKKVILVTTMWDRVGREDGLRREDELTKTRDFWGWMLEKGSRCCRHDNTAASARDIVGLLAASNQRIKTDIQRELVDEHRELGDTSAGREVQSEILREREKWTKELRETEAQMKEAIRQKDTETAQILSEERDKYARMIKRVESDTDSLRVNMQNLLKERDIRIARMEVQMRMQSRAHDEQLRKISEQQATAERRAREAHEEELRVIREQQAAVAEAARGEAAKATAEAARAEAARAEAEKARAKARAEEARAEARAKKARAEARTEEAKAVVARGEAARAEAKAKSEKSKAEAANASRSRKDDSDDDDYCYVHGKYHRNGVACEEWCYIHRRYHQDGVRCKSYCRRHRRYHRNGNKC